jgi:hypothetical protein
VHLSALAGKSLGYSVGFTQKVMQRPLQTLPEQEDEEDAVLLSIAQISIIAVSSSEDLSLCWKLVSSWAKRRGGFLEKGVRLRSASCWPAMVATTMWDGRCAHSLSVLAGKSLGYMVLVSPRKSRNGLYSLCRNRKMKNLLFFCP